LPNKNEIMSYLKRGKKPINNLGVLEVIDLNNDKEDDLINGRSKFKEIINGKDITPNKALNSNKIEYINLIDPAEDYTINSFDLDMVKNPFKSLFAKKSSNIEKDLMITNEVIDLINLEEKNSEENGLNILNGGFEEKYLRRVSSNSTSNCNNLININLLQISNNLNNNYKKQRFLIYGPQYQYRYDYCDIEYVNNIDEAAVPIWKVINF
jgi:hypothetical protein